MRIRSMSGGHAHPMGGWSIGGANSRRIKSSISDETMDAIGKAGLASHASSPSQKLGWVVIIRPRHPGFS